MRKYKKIYRSFPSFLETENHKKRPVEIWMCYPKTETETKEGDMELLLFYIQGSKHAVAQNKSVAPQIATRCLLNNLLWLSSQKHRTH